MRHEPLPGVGLVLLGIGIAVGAILGPLVLGLIRFPISENMGNQLAGGEFVSLVLAAPLAVVAGVLWLRGHRLAPVLALASALYAVYMYPQYIVGPEYSRYEGNSELAFPLYLALVVLGLATALRAWSALRGNALPAPAVGLRRILGGVLIAVNGLFAAAWIASVLSVLGGARSPEYLADPTLFWLIRLQDLGFVIPAGLIIGVGLLRDAAWATRAAVAFVGVQTLLVSAVAGMATMMTVRGDPAADPVLLTVMVAAFSVLIAIDVQLLRNALQARPGTQEGGHLSERARVGRQRRPQSTTLIGIEKGPTP